MDMITDATGMGDIIGRKVTRWYYNGKGYASQNSALRAKAKKLLFDEVLGETETKTDYDDYGHSYEVKLGRKHLRDVEDIKDTIADLFAEKFPHRTDESCAGTCYMRYQGDGETEDGFVFASCKVAQKEWIENKVKELSTHKGEKS